MALFVFKLVKQDGTPAEPATLHTAAPNWQPGDTISRGSKDDLRVIDVRVVDDGEVVLVVEPV